MKKLLFLLLLATAAMSAQNAARQYLGHTRSAHGAEVRVSDGTYRIRFYNPNIAETTFIPKGESAVQDSHAVIAPPQILSIGQEETQQKLEFVTSGITVQIEKSPCRISYFFGSKLLLSEKDGFIQKDSTRAVNFNLTPDEALYGGGARVLGMDRRGNRLKLYNRAHYGYETRSELMNFTMPLVLSSKIYAVHFDNPAIGFLDLDSQKNNTLEYEVISGRMTYQVIAHENWERLIENYTHLTGRQPMPPRWALGNFASRFGYHSQKEAEATIAKFKQEKIPVDAIILDLYWFGKDIKGTLGNLRPYRDSFPDFEGMIARFKQQGIRTIPITEPFILTTSSRWDEAVKNDILAKDSLGKPFVYDFYFGNTGLIDLFKPSAREWFWNIYKNLGKMGVEGVWGDLGEPEVHPAKLRHATGTADELHNIYGHEWAKLVFEGYKRDFPGIRPFILMRSGYSGSQRYGMIPWSGDVNRTWGGLSGQTEIALQMGMQGMGYMHSDLGGFAGENLDDELYVRWLQYGVFQPIFRPHAQEEVPSEPVYRSAKAMQLAKKAIELRYELMPYNYTLAFQNNQSGTPLMRPVLFEEPQNPKAHRISDQYLWGDAFLVAPVFAAGQKTREVYFPRTSNWFELGRKKYNAGATHTIPLVEDEIPVFVRGGAFIPVLPKAIQNELQYPKDNLTIRYIHDDAVKKSSGIFYDDDGLTPQAFEKGQYEILRFTSRINGRSLHIEVTSEAGANWDPVERELLFEVYDLMRKATYPVKLKSGKSKKITLNLDRK